MLEQSDVKLRVNCPEALAVVPAISCVTVFGKMRKRRTCPLGVKPVPEVTKRVVCCGPEEGLMVTNGPSVTVTET